MYVCLTLTRVSTGIMQKTLVGSEQQHAMLKGGEEGHGITIAIAIAIAAAASISATAG